MYKSYLELIMANYYNSLDSINMDIRNMPIDEINKLLKHPNVLFQLAVAKSEYVAQLHPELFLQDDAGGLSGLMISNWFVLNMAANQNEIARCAVHWDLLQQANKINADKVLHNPNFELIKTAQEVSDRQEIRELAKHPNIYVVEGIAKNPIAPEQCPDLFLNKKLLRKNKGFLVSDWHILRSAALGNIGIDTKDLNWAYKFDMRDKAHYVRDTEAYTSLAANPKTSINTLESLIKNEKDYAVIHAAQTARNIRAMDLDDIIQLSLHPGLTGTIGGFRRGNWFACWVLCGAPYDDKLIKFLDASCKHQTSLRDIKNSHKFNKPELEKYTQIINKRLGMFRPELTL